MTRQLTVTVVRLAIALVWLVNGLVAKVLRLVERHELIVARILGQALARPLTVGIGVAEIMISIWAGSGRWPRLCAATQIAAILTMNVLELAMAADLLLWGRLNLGFALAFCAIICWYGFVLPRSAPF